MRLNTYEWGDPAGRPLICLHGVTGHGGRFALLASRLPAHRVIGVDLRGHGHSGADPPWDIPTLIADLVETADDLGVESAAWLGHSFGGRIVAELSAAAPERVERVVLLDPAMRIEPDVAYTSAEGLRPEVVAAVFVDNGDRGAAQGLSERALDPLRIEGTFSDGNDGRAEIEIDASLEGAFRTPRLRCVAERPSFMHTGQLRTLDEVVAFHARGGDPAGYPGRNELSRLDLDVDERAAIVAFLGTLTGPGPAPELLRPPP